MKVLISCGYIYKPGRLQCGFLQLILENNHGYNLIPESTTYFTQSQSGKSTCSFHLIFLKAGFGSLPVVFSTKRRTFLFVHVCAGFIYHSLPDLYVPPRNRSYFRII